MADRPPSAPTPDAAPRVSPFCAFLRSKKILLSAEPPRSAADVLDASNHCWCGKNQKLRGPDREIASPELCQKGRECFESPFEALL